MTGRNMLESIATAAADVPDLICFSGKRERPNDNEGLIPCAKGMHKKINRHHYVNVSKFMMCK